jgi:uncharacterized protein (TIGR02118 family)
MVRFTVLWKNKPADAEAFELHYRQVHIPLAKKMAGIRSYTLSHDISPVRGDEPFMIAALDWDDMDSLRRAFRSPEGRALSADVDYIVGEFGLEVQSMAYQLEDL